MISNSCCFTGHRRLPRSKLEYIVKQLDNEMENLMGQGVASFISGGAWGFDLIAASLVVAKRELGHDVRLVFALPCRDRSGRRKTLCCTENCLQRRMKFGMFPRSTASDA